MAKKDQNSSENITDKETANVTEETKAEETVKDDKDKKSGKKQSKAADDKKSESKKNDELEKAKEQITALSDKLIRNAAEFDNYKKRTAREKEDFYKSAVCETVLPLLGVLDNLTRAVDAAEGDGGTDSILDGIKMIKKQFEDTLKSIGVEEIQAVGCDFDPEKHNAVMTGESEEKENTVIEEFQKGYIFRDKVIRHSMVKVSN